MLWKATKAVLNVSKWFDSNLTPNCLWLSGFILSFLAGRWGSNHKWLPWPSAHHQPQDLPFTSLRADITYLPPKQLTALRCPRWCQRVLEIVPQICWILSQPGGCLLILEEVARKPARTYCNYIYAHIVNRYEYYCLRYHPTGVYYLQDATPTRCCHSLSQANEPTNAENFSMSEARTGMNVVTCQPRKNPLSFSLEIMADLLWRISKKILA